MGKDFYETQVICLTKDFCCDLKLKKKKQSQRFGFKILMFGFVMEARVIFWTRSSQHIGWGRIACLRVLGEAKGLQKGYRRNA